jgi:hypothetical protein
MGKGEGEMTTTPQDALIKIRNQIRIAEGYSAISQKCNSPEGILLELRKREKVLANQIQVEYFQAEIRKRRHYEVKAV